MRYLTQKGNFETFLRYFTSGIENLNFEMTKKETATESRMIPLTEGDRSIQKINLPKSKNGSTEVPPEPKTIIT